MHLQERRILALVSSHIFYHHNLWLHFPIHATNKTECNSVTGLNELSHDSNQYFLVEWVLLTEWGTDIFGTINKYIIEGKGLNMKWNSVSTLLWVVNNPQPPPSLHINKKKFEEVAVENFLSAGQNTMRGKLTYKYIWYVDLDSSEQGLSTQHEILVGSIQLSKRQLN